MVENVFTHDVYLSPLTWRYGSDEMRQLWSEAHKRRLWRRIWLALAEAQAELGLVAAEQVRDLRAHVEEVDMDSSLQIESEIQHDLMAEVRAYARQCPVGGGIIHLGATSADIEDNAEAFRMRQGLDLILQQLRALLLHLSDRIEEHADQACMGYTHLQPAEPTTVGYRLAQYGLDLLIDWEEATRLRGRIRGKGFRGATGTSASYTQLLAESGTRPAELEAKAMSTLGLEAFPVATQTYPRKQDWLVLNVLAGLGGSAYRFAFDLRLLHSAPLGEWTEPFGAAQVGSSAMPFKRNPIHAENIDSLARMVASLPRVAWDNAAHAFLERTLDDKANRRMIIPQAFLLTDEILRRAHRLLQGLAIQDRSVAQNLALFGVFSATERLLMELVRAGADRQAMHELIRTHSMAAWDAIQAGQPNPLTERLADDPTILTYLSPDQVTLLLDASAYVGDAPARARGMADRIREVLGAGGGDL
jgi:adenylosuccinate lyase